MSGRNSIKMELLRELFNDLGYRNVQTYVQSGNVIFDSATSNETKISTKVKTGIQKKFGFSIPVLIVPTTSLKKIIQKNPFLKETDIDPTKLHVTFLSQMPSKLGLEKLQAIQAGVDQFRCMDNLIYLHCPNGYGRTKLSNNAIEKATGVEATTRNWKSINELHRISTK